MIRRWVLRIHLYGGLLCFWYLLIFAVSSLHYQHHFGFMEKKAISERSAMPSGSVDVSESDSSVATALRDELGLAGWYLPWKTHRDTAGIFHTEVQNFKANYQITYDPTRTSIGVIKTDRGFWGVFNALHGFAGKMPNAPMMFLWTWFTYFCIATVVFSIFSGIWLWTQTRAEKNASLILLSVLLGISFALMITVYING